MRTCPHDGHVCHEQGCMAACLQGGEKAPHRSREELVMLLDRTEPGMNATLNSADARAIADWIREVKREPSRYRVSWMQLCTQEYDSYNEAVNHARILQCAPTRNTDIKVSGIYDIDAK